MRRSFVASVGVGTAVRLAAERTYSAPPEPHQLRISVTGSWPGVTDMRASARPEVRRIYRGHGKNCT